MVKVIDTALHTFATINKGQTAVEHLLATCQGYRARHGPCSQDAKTIFKPTASADGESAYGSAGTHRAVKATTSQLTVPTLRDTHLVTSGGKTPSRGELPMCSWVEVTLTDSAISATNVCLPRAPRQLRLKF